jgi:predicted dehydrogenase
MKDLKSEELKIGVIGSGGRGVIAAFGHRPDEGSRIIACCDHSVQTLEDNRAAYGENIFTTRDYRELLRQSLDAVFVTTPDFLHEEMAVAALEGGIAVYLEKPMAITVEGCDRILRAAYTSGSRLYVGHNMRHMVFIRKMKELIDDGVIGNVKAIWCRHFVGHGGDYYFKDWHAEARYSTGLLLQKGAHDIDVIHWLAGGYSQRVHGFGGLTVYGDIADRAAPTEEPRGRPHSDENMTEWPPSTLAGLNHTIDVEDLSMMEMVLDNGVFATYQQCHYTPDYWRNYCVIGDEGRLENFGNGEDGSCIKVWKSRKAGWNAPDEVHMIDPAPLDAHGGSDVRIVSEFLNFVRHGGITTTSPLGARYSVAAGCIATESLRANGRTLDVPTVAPDIADYFENGQSRKTMEDELTEHEVTEYFSNAAIINAEAREHALSPNGAR